MASAAMACSSANIDLTERRRHAVFAPLPDHDPDQGIDFHPAPAFRSTIIDVRIGGARSVQASCSSMADSAITMRCAGRRQAPRASGQPAADASTARRPVPAASFRDRRYRIEAGVPQQLEPAFLLDVVDDLTGCPDFRSAAAPAGEP